MARAKGALALFALLVLAPAAVLAQYDVDPDLVVATTNGKIYGEKYAGIGRAFRGVPYAAPPVGREGRWQLPRAPPSWGPDALPTRDYRPGCAQRCEDGVQLPPHTCPQLISEDCLYLNVYTPPTDRNVSNLPVLFFIHGGNFIRGAANLLYEGLPLANLKNVIVVGINYRLGAFGFLVAPALSGGKALNLGIEDQRMALHWVQDNIRNFGGDPSKVTIYGQSAGARSVIMHLVSPSSAGLFSAAAILSDPGSIVCSSVEDALALADRFGEAIGCSSADADCLYSKSVDEIVDAQEEAVNYLVPDSAISTFMQILPTVDGVEVTGQPMRMLLEGDFNRVPLIIGTVSEETVLYIYSAWPNPVTTASYRALLQVVFRENATAVFNHYPPLAGDDQREVMHVMGTDFTFTCPDRFVMRALSNYVPTYAYVYDHAWTFDGWGDHFAFCDGHVCHGADMPMLFDTASLMFELEPAEETLAHDMMHYLGNFAWSQDPSRDNRGYVSPVAWNRYTIQNDQVLLQQTPACSTVSGYRKTDCDFWDTIGYDPLRKDPGDRFLVHRLM